MLMAYQIAMGVALVVAAVGGIGLFIGSMFNPISPVTMAFMSLMVGGGMVFAMLAMGPVLIQIIRGWAL